MYNHTAGTTSWKTPPNWAHMTRQEQIDWRKAWEETPEGKERKRHQWAEHLDLNPDGSFRIEDLVPGTYHVQLRMFHNENGFGEDLVDSGLDFTVPPLPPGQTRTDEPLDLGTIPVTLKPRALVGQVAPDFTVQTLDGKPLKLSDYRGKYVLLKWFWSWSELDTEIPAIQKAYDTIKDDPNWALITIDFDQPLDLAKKRVAAHHIPGLHAYTAQESKAFPRAYLGSPSTLIIIGPDGKVLARNLHAQNAETEIAKIRLERQ
jgi:peroxiredoxin